MGLKINDVHKSYNGKAALKNCTFTFAQGHVYALMGPNGCGKSTLLRVCALLEPCDRGDITFFSGESVFSNDIALRRRITLVLPRIGVFNTSVFKNVSYGLVIRGLRKAAVTHKVDEILRVVGLINKRDEPARTLSSGETQRLGIARAMVLEPDVLFLDEPTAFTDVENTSIIEGIILTMKNQGGTTIIMSTHDWEQAKRLACEVLSMHDGRITGPA